MPRVSVIAMTLNHERYAAAGLDAIAAQTFSDFELVVTDDGSTDATPDIIERARGSFDRPFELIAHDTSRGICQTLNEALTRCSGDLLAVVSLDDMWFPDRLAAHVAAFDRATPDVAVVYGDSQVIDEEGKVTAPSYLQRYTRYRLGAQPPPPQGDVFAEIVRGNFISTPSVTMRRAAIDEVGGYDESLAYEDWPMWLTLAARHRFAFDPAVVGQYRLHGGGAWHHFQRRRRAASARYWSLATAVGRRADVDALVVRRLRELFDYVVGYGDEDADACGAHLAGLCPPVELPASEPLEERQARAASLIADGYSLAEPDAGGAREPAAVTRLVPQPSGILYLAPWVMIGGADRSTVDWFRHVDRDAYRRYLVTTTDGDNALFATCADLADEAWCLPELVTRQSIPQFLIDLVATRGIDAVHIMNSKLGYDLIPALKHAFPRLPVVLQLHCEEAGRTGYPRYVTARYDNLIDAYSVVSHELADCLVEYKVSPSRVHVIYLGVDAVGEFDPDRTDRVPQSLDASGFNVLFPSRLVPQKRPDLVLDIAEAARNAIPSVRFHMVGEGELRGELEAACARRRLEDTVLFHGATLEMWGWYRACDVVLLCSAFEGIPLVLYEAMSMGVPAVSPLVGAVGELLDDRSGIAVAPDAGPDAYAEALAALAADPDRRASIRRTSRARVLEEFEVTDMGRRHKELYAHLIAQAGIRS